MYYNHVLCRPALVARDPEAAAAVLAATGRKGGTSQSAAILFYSLRFFAMYVVFFFRPGLRTLLSERRNLLDLRGIVQVFVDRMLSEIGIQCSTKFPTKKIKKYIVYSLTESSDGAASSAAELSARFAVDALASCCLGGRHHCGAETMGEGQLVQVAKEVN